MSAAFAALALALEAAAVAALGDGLYAPALALHVAAAGALGHAFATHRALAPRAAFATGWLWAGALPAFGVAAGAALLLLRGRTARARAVEESWRERRSEAARRAQREAEHAQYVAADVVPLVDALRAARGDLRISAIEAVKDRTSKPIVMLLARERQNTLYDVRFRAVEHLGRITDESLARIAAAEAALAAGPESAALHEQLARLLFEHGELGLDAPEVTRSHLARVVVHAERASLLDGKRAAPLVLLARSFWRLGALDRAELELRRAQELDRNSAEALFALAELQFARKDFRALAATCARLQDRAVLLTPPQRQVVRHYARLGAAR